MTYKTPVKYKLIKLSEILNFVKKTNHRASEGQQTGKYKFFSSSAIQTKFSDSFDYDGEYLIFGTGGTASVHYCNGRFSSTADCLVANITTSFSIKYVHKYLHYNIHLLEEGFRGAGLKHISKSYIEKIQIAIPNDKIAQEKIVSILDKTELLQQWRKESDKLTKDYLNSIFYKMFGDMTPNNNNWPLKTVREAAEKVSDGPFGSNLKTEHYTNDGVRVIRLQNIGVGQFLDNDRAFISLEHYSKLKKHTCCPGDVIVGTLGDPNLRACILPNNVSLAINKADCIQIRPNKNMVNAEYLCYLLNTPQMLHFASNYMHGQTRTRISMSQVASLPLPIPPLSLQNKFALIVNSFDFLLVNLKVSKSLIDRLSEVLMKEAFNGELTC
jgi:type I restriction enzyme S subunit